jgi:hypothetical protein
MKRAFASLCALLLLAGCTQPSQSPQRPPDVAAEELRQIEKARELMLPRETDSAALSQNQSACQAIGGSYGRDGMLGAFHCVLTYSDAGNPCNDKADCKGSCRAKTDGALRANKLGICQTTTSPFGCYATVNDGKVGGMLCVD